MMKKQIIRCPYCGSPAILRDTSYVHGKNAWEGKLYVCSRYPVCNSYVSVLNITVRQSRQSGVARATCPD